MEVKIWWTWVEVSKRRRVCVVDTAFYHWRNGKQLPSNIPQAQPRRIEICEKRLFWEWGSEFATLVFSLIKSMPSGRICSTIWTYINKTSHIKFWIWYIFNAVSEPSNHHITNFLTHTHKDCTLADIWRYCVFIHDATEINKQLRCMWDMFFGNMPSCMQQYQLENKKKKLITGFRYVFENG